MMKFNIWAGIFLITIGCGHTAKEAARKKMIGINGESIYVLNKDGSIWSVYKEEYNTNDYSVMIKGDTVALGSNFVGLLHAVSWKYKVLISSPTEAEIQSDESHKLKEYKFTPEKEGIYEFKGVIEYDSTSVPFEYKFIVIK